MEQPAEAYLDIETTGLSPLVNEITVVGIHVCKGNNYTKFTHIIGDNISSENILEALSGVEVIYTYNGSRFDLPFIDSRLGINLAETFGHRDLMYDCWNCNLYGGLKAVERQLGIERELTDINGFEAIRLWWKYTNDYDEDALATLLKYNKEDVLNLKTLKEKLLTDT